MRRFGANHILTAALAAVRWERTYGTRTCVSDGVGTAPAVGMCTCELARCREREVCVLVNRFPGLQRIPRLAFRGLHCKALGSASDWQGCVDAFGPPLCSTLGDTCLSFDCLRCVAGPRVGLWPAATVPSCDSGSIYTGSSCPLGVFIGVSVRCTGQTSGTCFVCSADCKPASDKSVLSFWASQRNCSVDTRTLQAADPSNVSKPDVFFNEHSLTSARKFTDTLCVRLLVWFECTSLTHPS